MTDDRYRPRRSLSPPRITEAADLPSKAEVERQRQQAKRPWARIVRLR